MAVSRRYALRVLEPFSSMEAQHIPSPSSFMQQINTLLPKAVKVRLLLVSVLEMVFHIALWQPKLWAVACLQDKRLKSFSRLVDAEGLMARHAER
ncbi:hypothetical protein [Shewanella salipaludis]|uniref:Uncharacterized protein n=1 Tax=Shewanella salipaludis TaxID=2723052 RepID=A0A972FTH9_9GAMM|nr:hypothetical protein [Shewanella salipaludis]NMH64939.1 hypothetical protein [Shewanella salipaludis]